MSIFIEGSGVLGQGKNAPKSKIKNPKSKFQMKTKNPKFKSKCLRFEIFPFGF
jgi:hypothetical protein